MKNSEEKYYVLKKNSLTKLVLINILILLKENIKSM